ncbi:MAG: hypothetical protein US15_C0019G0010 [Candidatus Moranbacteria bacterium GW2011_GWF1_36_4]|nr:MAG: hypothetical protein US15_C0019G0010 [Candidatus Moranbacteria bacterium GW2011_GWF1_36_4]KKQ28636.1 MAG: hypothetical protein US44_C0008G0010 [Candidatus Moranbacteria bacterium GW2011_GWD1_37_17]KKQ47221.1 MAG: hypothetical protein US66_C0016G0020 [Candidatus Moranbacteria bacterium GW2011_GWD2_37_9]
MQNPMIDDEDDNVSFADTCLLLMLGIVMTLSAKHIIETYPTNTVADPRLDVLMMATKDNAYEVKCNGKVSPETLAKKTRMGLEKTNVHVAIHSDKKITAEIIAPYINAVDGLENGKNKVIWTFDLLQ